MNRTTLISALVVAALALLGIGAMSLTGPSVEEAAAPAEATQTAEAEAGASADIEIAEMTLGEANAPVKIIEYASFTCPHCASFHEESFKQLKAEYIDTGKAHFTYREVYFDRAALWASMLARCGGEEKFFGLSDLIFKGMRDWVGDGDPVKMADGLRKIGRIAGLDGGAIDACLEDQAKAEALVGWYQTNSEADDINSTPTFLVNGTRVEGNNPARLREVIDAALAE